MSTEYALAKGTNHHKRDKHSVVCDARVHQLLSDDSGINSVKFALSQDRLEEELRDDRLYFVEKNLYHTLQNIDQSNMYKVNEGPRNRGLAGDIDAGYIDLNTGEIRNIELKSKGTVQPVESIGEDDRTPSCVKKGRDTNSYIGDLLRNFESNGNFQVPYNPSVQVWNGVMTPVNLKDVPRYSNYGTVIASDEAIEKAQNSPKIQKIDEAMFNCWLLGGGEVVDLDELTYEL